MTTYTVAVFCQNPHKRYNRKVRYEWYPSGSEIYGIIRKLRHEAKSDGILEVVKIAEVVIRKTETIETVNGLIYTSEQDDRL